MKLCAVAVFVLAMLSVISAHDFRDISGTIVSVSKTRITVKTADGTNEWINVARDTKIVRGRSSATMKDLKKGLRVLVHAVAHGDYIEASEIELLRAARK